MSEKGSFFPGRAPINAYGNGGFRFAEMSHPRSLLLLPSGIYAWKVKSLNQVSKAKLEQVLTEREAIEFLLLGTGDTQLIPPASVTTALEKADIGLEVMDTGAAARTWNVLLGENRAVAAALIAVD
ncbi:MAG: MTH938/NDUFAF3 family protein [Hyphomicrobiales bacterium]|nr:MTH938/NDUFAF3 family protein [Hyphomicrobiales bacterium]